MSGQRKPDKLLGLLFAALALATIARMGAAAGQLSQLPGLVPALNLAPFVLWFAGAILFVALARAVMPLAAQPRRK